VFINVVAVRMVQVTVVQIINMAVVFHGDVAATRRVDVSVTLVFGASHVPSFENTESAAKFPVFACRRP
jgi:hypothetical protein